MNRSLSLLLIGSALVAGSAASAQIMKNHNSNAPVNFSADRIEVQDRSDRVVLSGKVEVDQAGLTLNAARMTVAYRNDPNAGRTPNPAGGSATGNVAVDRIDASGNVVVVKGNETARGNIAIYDLNRRLITMLGNVELNQGSNRLTGGRLVIDLTSGRSTVDGKSAVGPSSSSSGRVSGTFTVPQRTPQ
jgi:lipopolysaccharide export system protein LptA